VPLTVGGGIRGFTDAQGHTYSALDVAAEYFRSGADKVCCWPAAWGLAWILDTTPTARSTSLPSTSAQGPTCCAAGLPCSG
jgi:hypothetical protein